MKTTTILCANCDTTITLPDNELITSLWKKGWYTIEIMDLQGLLPVCPDCIEIITHQTTIGTIRFLTTFTMELHLQVDDKLYVYSVLASEITCPVCARIPRIIHPSAPMSNELFCTCPNGHDWYFDTDKPPTEFNAEPPQYIQ